MDKTCFKELDAFVRRWLEVIEDGSMGAILESSSQLIVDMTPNKKLTKLLRGRTIEEFRSDVSGLSVGFSDGSVLLVKGKETTDEKLKPGSTIASVFEQGDEFVITCEDQSRFSLELAEPGSSVSVRGSDGKVQYLG